MNKNVILSIGQPMKNKNREIFSELSKKWKEIDFDVDLFSKYLKKTGWKDINEKGKHGMFKRVFSKEGIVVKFDDDRHTLSEHRAWLSSGNKRKKYICPSFFYYQSMLFQPLLSNVCDNIDIVPREVHLIAKKFRFSHYWNYGFLDGKLKFFDTDRLYYQLTDKEERIK